MIKIDPSLIWGHAVEATLNKGRPNSTCGTLYAHYLYGWNEDNDELMKVSETRLFGEGKLWSLLKVIRDISKGTFQVEGSIETGWAPFISTSFVVTEIKTKSDIVLKDPEDIWAFLEEFEIKP
jgi:hypothetical protein